MALRIPDRLQPWLAVLLAWPVLFVWTWWAGKDLSWDLLNHHIYLPWSWVTGRHALDLFAAGPQSYLNPLGYVPFLGLLQASTSDTQVAVALALMHALLAWPLWRLAQAWWPEDVGDTWWRGPALALAAMAPTFLLVAGTSSSDPLSALLVLLALDRAVVARPSMQQALWAGCCVGLAVAIKPTNVIFVLGVACAWPWREGRGRQVLALLGAATAVALLGHGPWSWWLWQTFGNPVFPLFNHWFQSPYAPTDPASAARFVPHNLQGWLTWPWRVAQPQRLTHTEALAPDLRPLVAAMSMLLAAGVLLVRRLYPASGPGSAGARWLPTDGRMLAFGFVSTLGWLATSANSRYALALFLLAGLAAVRGLQLALPHRAARVAIGLLLVLQAAYWWELGTRRFDRPVAWGQPAYLTAEIPVRLRQEPALHLALGTPSYAALAMQLHPEGRYINAISSMSLPNDGPLGLRLAAHLDRWHGRTRVLARGLPPLGDSPQADAARRHQDRILYRFGLQTDWSDCEVVRIVTPVPRVVMASPRTINLTSCKAQPRKAVDPDYERSRARADQAFAAVERACPRVFGPRPMVTDASLNAWHRHYMSTDARITVSEADGVAVSYFGAWGSQHLGGIDDVIAGRGRPACAAWQDLTRP